MRSEPVQRVCAKPTYTNNEQVEVGCLKREHVEGRSDVAHELWDVWSARTPARTRSNKKSDARIARTARGLCKGKARGVPN